MVASSIFCTRHTTYMHQNMLGTVTYQYLNIFQQFFLYFLCITFHTKHVVATTPTYLNIFQQFLSVFCTSHSTLNTL